MAVERRALEALLYASGRHKFGKTVMIGRHGISLKPRTLRRIFRSFDVELTPDQARAISETKFAEPLLAHLGAEATDSIDISDYQGANLTADLSKPIPDSWRGRYDTVLDFATIEHVFNFPQAIENCLALLRPGGLYVCLTTANNYCGHGFYQFAPEVWFSLFRVNHFEDVEVFLLPTRPEPLWFRVDDPYEIGGRVLVINNEMTFVLAMARKTADAPVSLVHPQQTDYAGKWKGMRPVPPAKSLSSRILRALRSATGVISSFAGRSAVIAVGLSGNRNLSRFNPAVPQLRAKADVAKHRSRSAFALKN